MQAPQLRVPQWIDGDGETRSPLALEELGAELKVIYCFQHWCPGCHSAGFPTLQQLVGALKSYDVGFAVVQTVFEGFDSNTFDRLRETQLRYGLDLPFGHDGSDGEYPTIMQDYQTRGTPWFILIDSEGSVIFSDFQLDGGRLIKIVQDMPRANDRH